MYREDLETSRKDKDNDIGKGKRRTVAGNELMLLGSSFPVSLTEVYYSTMKLEAEISSER
jgi:hypothetical protein